MLNTNVKNLAPFLLFSIFMLVLAIIGGIRSYSPVPHFDMWDGYVNFFHKASEGGLSPWWEQHNEHRLLLSKVFFWLDFKFFGGLSYFLFIVNYLLLFLIIGLFWKLLLEIRPKSKFKIPQIIFGLFITAWLLQWTQSDNLTSGFQVQFFLTVIFALMAFYFLYKSSMNARYFFLAIFSGIASVGAMANGVLVLPLMLCYTLITRQRFIKSIIIAVLSVILICLYFYHYQSPDGHGQILAALKENPAGILTYMLLYLGSPFHYLVFKGYLGKFIAFLAGILFLMATMRIFFKSILNPSKNLFNLSLVTFIIFVIAMAFGTAGGRLVFGVSQSLYSRYTTFVLVAWALLFLLHSDSIFNLFTTKNKKNIFAFGTIILLMTVNQFKALRSKQQVFFNQNIAVLALTLGVKDQKQLQYIYPEFERVLEISEKTFSQKLSVFNTYPFNEINRFDPLKYNPYSQKSDLPICQGKITMLEPIAHDARFIRVKGWIHEPESKTVPKFLRFVDLNQRIIGYAMTGEKNNELRKTVGRYASRAGYIGYIKTDAIDNQFKILSEASPSCVQNL